MPASFLPPFRSTRWTEREAALRSPRWRGQRAGQHVSPRSPARDLTVSRRSSATCSGTTRSYVTRRYMWRTTASKTTKLLVA